MQSASTIYGTIAASNDQTVILRARFGWPFDRMNLCPNPSFEVGLFPWAPYTTPRVEISTTRAWIGTRSMLVTWALGGNPFVNCPITLVVGETYTVSAYVWVAPGATGVGIGINNSTGAVSTLTGQWQRISFTFTANVAAVLFGTVLSVGPNGSPFAGDQVWVDGIMVEKTSTLNTYFDGDSNNCLWNDEPGQSTSTSSTYNDMTMTVTDCSLDRSLSTDMPTGTRFVTGAPAAQLDITLDGLVDRTDASKTVAWLLGRYQTTSPMFRASALNMPVTVDMGLLTRDAALTTAPYSGIEFVRVLTGVTDAYTINPDGTVTFTCLDSRTRFSSFPALPPGAYSYGAAQPLMTAGWVLNALCESNGRYTSPPPRWNCLHRQSNHGGAWPELSLDAFFTVTSINDPGGWTAGKFSSQVPTTFGVNYYNSPPGGASNGLLAGDIGSSGDSWFTECWVKATTDAEIVTPLSATQVILLNAGTPGVTLTFGSQATSLGSALRPYVTVTVWPSASTVTVNAPTLTIPNDGNFHYFAVAFHFTSTTGFAITFYVDATTETATGTAGAAVGATIHPIQISLSSLCPMESVQLTTETYAPPAGNTFVPSPLAVLDASLNNLTVIPDLTGQDEWGVIQLIADAEQGIAGLDENDVFRFRNRDSLLTAPSVRSITSTTSLASLQVQTARVNVANHIRIPVTQLQVGAYTWVWAAPGVIPVPAGGQWTATVTTDNPVVNVQRFDNGFAPTGQQADGNTYWRASTKADGTGTVINTGVTVVTEQVGPATLHITVTNNRGGIIYLVSPTGSPGVGNPFLLIGGQFVTTTTSGGDSTVAVTTSGGGFADSQFPPVIPDGGAATNPYGEQLLTLTDNPWRQNLPDAQLLADYLLADLATGRPQWPNTLIVGDGRLQRGDRVTVVDPDVTGMSEDAFITRLGIESDWSMPLELRAVGDPGSWMIDLPGRSELGDGPTTSTIWIT